MADTIKIYVSDPKALVGTVTDSVAVVTAAATAAAGSATSAATSATTAADILSQVQEKASANHLDGGNARSVYLASQVYDGGGANG